jgi:hypothetical protein
MYLEVGILAHITVICAITKEQITFSYHPRMMMSWEPMCFRSAHGPLANGRVCLHSGHCPVHS